MKTILTQVQKDCLINLVGVSNLNCDCYESLDEEVITAYQESATGMYLDQDEGISPCLVTTSNCWEHPFLEKLKISRELAVTEIITSSSLELSKVFEPKTNRYHNLGSSQYNGFRTESEGVKRIVFKTAHIKGGLVKIVDFGFCCKMLTNSATSEMNFLLKKNGELIYTIEFVAQMDKTNGFYSPDIRLYKLPEPIYLETDGSEYTLEYEYNPSLYLVCQNKITCGCAATRSVIGHYFDKLPDSEAFGMMLGCQFSCDNRLILCSLINENPLFVGLAAKMIIAKTLSLFLSKEQTAARLGISSNYLIKSIDFDGMIGTYEGMYSSALNEMITQISVYQFNLPCFTCRKNRIGRREGIIF